MKTSNYTPIDDTPDMLYVVSLSGGVGSACAADRAIQRFGKNRVKLWFADVGTEDEDLYRFMADCQKRWQMKVYVRKNARTPLDVAEWKCIIPNEKRAPCTYELKIAPFREYIATLPRPLCVLLGMDWKEQHRLAAPRKAYEEYGVFVDYPLMWQPWELRALQDVVRDDWGIEPPRLYKLGFPHNNCAGACVKQGVREWLRLRYHFPERFERMKQWELAQRAKGGARATHAICAEERDKVKYPVTLEEIERRLLEGGYQRQMEEIIKGTEYKDDRIHCFCAYA